MMECIKCRWKYPPETKIWCKYPPETKIWCKYFTLDRKTECYRCEEVDKNQEVMKSLTKEIQREQEILNLLKEITDNKEVVVTGGPATGYTNESRYCLKIVGPERLIKKLVDILWEVE